MCRCVCYIWKALLHKERFLPLWSFLSNPNMWQWCNEPTLSNTGDCAWARARTHLYNYKKYDPSSRNNFDVCPVFFFLNLFWPPSSPCCIVSVLFLPHTTTSCTFCKLFSYFSRNQKPWSHDKESLLSHISSCWHTNCHGKTDCILMDVTWRQATTRITDVNDRTIFKKLWCYIYVECTDICIYYIIHNKVYHLKCAWM